ncbi:MAG: ABC transporter ATP-binding protein [Rhizobiales bacterium]|nr:ABC transporter ATP-binding protein [Hyphomicrobiales bacterium]OJY45850.1 MAG: ABC transporter ATP-binding protein [Rhizobiales bacterium 64-17]
MLNFNDVSVEFETTQSKIVAVDHVTLDIQKQNFVCFVGPSGCGKTTLLNAAAGLVMPSTGTIRYDGQLRKGFNKDIGYVTQTETLFPWRTAAENVGLALELQNLPRSEINERVDRYMSLVGLRNFQDHYPRQLSGGMRRRAALARTWIYEPETVLMDEPFGALDEQLKLSMQKQLLDLWERNRSTIVFVTHDLAEAVTLADQVVVFTSRPARIKAVKTIDLPRPRDPYRIHFSKEVQSICAELWELLEDELRETVQ